MSLDPAIPGSLNSLKFPCSVIAQRAFSERYRFTFTYWVFFSSFIFESEFVLFFSHITFQCCCSAVQSQSLRAYYVLTQLFFLSAACFFGLMTWTCSSAFSAKQLTAFELTFPLARTYPTLLTNDFLLYTVRMLGFLSFARGTRKTSLWSVFTKTTSDKSTSKISGFHSYMKHL